VNVFAVLEIYKYFSEIFKQKGSGDFVNIWSISDKKPFLYDSIYAASKNALNTLNKWFYDEWKNYGYNSTLVYFGPLEKSEKTFLYKKEKYIDYFWALSESQKIKKTYIVKGILDLLKTPVSAYSVTIYGDK
jgi:short-subunit dehydrogenase